MAHHHQLSLKLSGARTLNRPKFDEIAPFREEKGARFVEGNPELEPARAWNVDLSGLYHSNDVTLGVALFYEESVGRFFRIGLRARF